MSHGRSNYTDQLDFSETDSTNMDIDDDLILDLSDSDIVEPNMEGHHGDSTHTPSASSGGWGMTSGWSRACGVTNDSGRKEYCVLDIYASMSTGVVASGMGTLGAQGACVESPW